MRILPFVLLVTACGGASHGSDAGARRDASSASDSGAFDAGTADAGMALDAGAAPLCGAGMAGRCEDPGLMCLCCPTGSLTQACFCTTHCTDATECTDSARPFCDAPPGAGSAEGICVPSMMCQWGATCASPDTPIATPSGERAIADLREGDLVYSMDEGALRIVPIARVARTPVHGHAVVRVRLATGAELAISAGHPTADGRTFGDLSPGGTLGGVRIDEVSTVPYSHAFTYDILPRSDSGTYVAGGALIGTTLAR